MKPKPSKGQAMTAKRKKVKISEIRRILHDILLQATRKNRACDNKYYLKVDLEIIAQSAQAGLDLCEKPRLRRKVV